MNICVVGTGYVGLVTGVCFAEKGHNVVCVDNNEKKVKMLQKGEVPIYEPGLEDLLLKNIKEGRLSFTSSLKLGISSCLAIFIAVPTPSKEDGSVDLTYVEEVAKEIGLCLTADDYRVVINKSTVPIKTGERVKETICKHNKNANVDVVSNPEFLKEGCAISDLMNPDRIVIGASSAKAIDIMKEIYDPFDASYVITDVLSAEIIKYAANSFLSLKISYINMLSVMCEACGADIEKVSEGIGSDKRIGDKFLKAGLGYGGSCFPKDVKAFISTSKELGIDFTLLEEVERINKRQVDRFVCKVKDALWILKEKRIAVWGLTFKPDTDDVRNSVAVELVNKLSEEGAKVVVYDPKGMENAKDFNLLSSDVVFADSPVNAVKGAEALIIATEWKEFVEQDFVQIRSNMLVPLLFDGRNILNPAEMKRKGFVYHSIGRLS